MKKEQSEKIAKYLELKPVKRAFLVGSSARGEDDEFSDIDILFELDYSVPIGLGFVKMKLELEELLRRKVDLLTIEGVSKYVRPFLDADKVLIYER